MIPLITVATAGIVATVLIDRLVVTPLWYLLFEFEDDRVAPRPNLALIDAPM